MILLHLFILVLLLVSLLLVVTPTPPLTMVKFGVHVEAFQKENQASQLYVVPYIQVRDEFIESPTVTDDPKPFSEEWNACLQNAKNDFDSAMSILWERVFQGIASKESARGAPPDKAFSLYFHSAGVEASQELLTSINAIYETSLTNAEALRKLVKKFDKQHNQHLSLTLLPPLFASNFVVGKSSPVVSVVLDDSNSFGCASMAWLNSSGIPMLEDGLSILRHALGQAQDDDSDDDSVESLGNQRKADRRGRQHDAQVERRKEELSWLRNLVASLPHDEVTRIVAHRGFHNPRGLSDKRPLENSLQAYEAAWTNGIHLCECDIALTKDEKLVLAHDQDFSRLALDKDSPMYNCQVRDLTFRELISLPLKSGIRPPLLIDVLRSARAIGGDSQLIIEIKPGNNDAAKALARLFLRHADLMEQCAVIMSFDLYAMHTLRNDLSVLQQASAPAVAALRPGHRSNMSLGNVALLLDPADVAAEGFVPLGSHRDSFDHYGVGLSLSTRETMRENTGNAETATSMRPKVPPLPPSTSPRMTPKPSHKAADGMTNSPSNGNMLPPSAIPTRSAGNTPKVSPSILSHKQELHKIPKLLLLTVCDKPKIPCELQVSVLETDKVEGWLHRDDGALDGVYMQFQTEMLEPEGTAALQELASKYSVGVWGHAHRDPDDYKTFHHLVKNGNVSYVNTDLPKGFRKRGLMDMFGGNRASSM